MPQSIDHDNATVRTVLERLTANRLQRREIDEHIAADEKWLAELRDDHGERTIEQHLIAISPSEGFDPTELSDQDRREIARCVLDAGMFGTAWLTRDPDHGYRREDPLRVQIHDSRLT